MMIKEKLEGDKGLSFWDLSPAQDTALGHIISYVIFRCVGMDMAKYVCEGNRAKVIMQENDTKYTVPEMAELEFFDAWQANPGLKDLQSEGIAFCTLFREREFQLWLVDSLAKLPMTQWEKISNKFTYKCGNIIYVLVYCAWLDALRKRSESYMLKEISEKITPLEKYFTSQVISGYTLDEEVAKTVQLLRERSKQHGTQTLYHEHTHVFNLLKKPRKVTVDQYYKLTDDGQEYYKTCAVLCGLWIYSLPKESDKADKDIILSGAVNSLVVQRITVYNMLRTYYCIDWITRIKKKKEEPQKEESTRESELLKETTKLKKSIEKSKKTVDEYKKALEKQKEYIVKLEEERKAAIFRAENAENQVAKLEAEKESVNKNKVIDENPKQPAESEEISTEVLNTRITKLSDKLENVVKGIDNLYTLLLAEGEQELSEVFDTEEVSEDAWKEQMSKFNGRLLVYGGTSGWRERVRKWFEMHDIKVRAFAPGDEVVRVNKTDLFFLNIIGNKHMYSVKCLDTVRKAGAGVRICGVTNLEQTLRIIFEQPQHRIIN